MIVTRAVKRTPADVLREARRRDSDRKRDQVFRTVDSMKRDRTPITFAAVARAAKVSQWLVYAEGVRDYIAAARAAQGTEPVRSQCAGRTASKASLRTDLELANKTTDGSVKRLADSRTPSANSSVRSGKPHQPNRSANASMN
jgi:hypothetical protein